MWLFGGSLGRTVDGALAERAAVGDAYAIEVPQGADPALAAGLGIAGLAGWLPFAWRAPLTGGEDVLVLGATGSVGLVAVQTAKLLGATRVVAAGRSAAGLQRAAEHGADATLQLSEDGDLVTAFRDAFNGNGPSFVFDALWGEPGAAAVVASAPEATVVNLGQSAGPTLSPRRDDKPAAGHACRPPTVVPTYWGRTRGSCSPDNPEMREHMANTIARHSRRGWRLDKPSLDTPNDSIIALCMALDALENQPEPVQLVGSL